MPAPNPSATVAAIRAHDRSWIMRLLSFPYDMYFGFDFFLSHRWSDGRGYAVALHECLKGKHVCFLDSEEFSHGGSWRKQARRALDRTKALVLVGTPDAYVRRTDRADPVFEEIRYFRENYPRRPLIVVDIDGAYLLSGNEAAIKEFIPEDILRIAEKPDGVKPSSNLIGEVLRGQTRFSELRKRRLIIWLTLLVFALAVATGLMMWRRSVAEANNARKQFGAKLFQQADRDIDTGSVNEGAARLVKAAEAYPEGFTDTRLGFLVRQAEAFQNVSSVKVSKAGETVLDVAAARGSREAVLVRASAGRVGIVSCADGSELHAMKLKENQNAVFARLNPWRKEFFALVHEGEEGSGTTSAAIHSFSADSPDVRTWNASDGITDIAFYDADHAVACTVDEIFLLERSAGENAQPGWRESGSRVSLLRKKGEDDSHYTMRRVFAAPELRKVMVVYEVSDRDSPYDVIECRTLDTLTPAGELLKPGDGMADHFYDLSLSVEAEGGAQDMAVVWSARYRNKNPACSVQIYHWYGEKWNLRRESTSEKPLNTVAWVFGDWFVIGSDDSVAYVVSRDDYISDKWFDIATAGAVRRIVATGGEKVWILKTDLPQWPASEVQSERPVIAQCWSRKAVTPFVAERISTPPVPVPPCASVYRSSDFEKPIFVIAPDFGRKWELRDGRLYGDGALVEGVDLTEFAPHRAGCISGSAGGAFLAIGGGQDPRAGQSGFAVVLDTMDTSRAVGPAMRHAGCVQRTYLSADGALMASISRESPPSDGPPTHVQIWDVANGLPLVTPLGLQELCPDLAGSAIHDVVATFSANNDLIYLGVITLDEEDKPPPPPRWFELRLPQATDDAFAATVSELEKMSGVRLSAAGAFGRLDRMEWRGK